MKKQVPVIIIAVMLILFSYELRSKPIQYNEDGSIQYTAKDGSVTIIPMDGKTPYGEPIEDGKRTVRRGDFTIEVIYSSRLSDDILDGPVKQLFDELVTQLGRWVNDNPLPAESLRLVISNCRFCKTGYCRRQKSRGIILTTYRGETELKRFIIQYEDLVKKGAAVDAAASAVKELMPVK
ncbi:MAG: hypothetical protein CVV44_09910 [Spirochaetae bacterium HGW-Spirochaetae-1]|jgi:hypothetical protein|nr:MAG: hypothetical protein CVV44_09910 [Spirochaetae bacterium HGW-Spirochaetae-1]